MSPFAHLVGSWLIASATTNNPRDRKLVTIAGVLPDADGLGAVADVVGSWISGKECTFYYYQTYHHLLLHGWPAAIAISILLTFFARQRWRVLLLGLLTFHLHLFCDLLGSRGPDLGDLWPICYSEPIFRHPIWFWKHQWKLDGWQNQTVFVTIFVVSLWLAVKRGYSFVEVISARLDTIFVGVLRKWFDHLPHREKLSP
jgi:inner membrane protein